MSFRKKIFMLQKLMQDITSDKKVYKLADDLHSPQLGAYYFLFDENRVATGKDQKLISRFDANGIPVNQTYIDVTDQDYVYFPISIGQMGLAVYHTWLASDSENDKVRFLNFAEWFKNNAEISAELGARWLTNVPLPQYHNPGPWQSAFSQSRAISILLRAYQISGDIKCLELAEQALIPFTFPVSEGGVTSYTEWGPFYEEYTAAVPTLVLNGMIFALFGIHDFSRVFPENLTAKNIFRAGIDTLEKILPQYDLGFWSRYNLCKAEWYPETDPATIRYQRLHIEQLKVLYRLTGNEIFQTYWQKFRKQDNLLSALRMYKLKFKALKKLYRI
jgi:hypothetical protein